MGIKKKLIILNSIIITIMVAISVTVMGIISSYTYSNDLQEDLLNVISKNANDLVTSDGNITVNEDFKFYDDGVYLSIYTETGGFVNGIYPENHDPNLPLTNGTINTYTYNGVKYTYYDFFFSLQGRSDVCLRGVIGETSSMPKALSTASAIIIPFLALLGVFGSIFVSRNATKPLMEIISKTDNINSSKDLNLRLNIDTKDKEILTLQNSYNDMLERLQDIFKHEEEFTSDVSHELRTPLTIIQSECEYAIEVGQSEEKNNSLEIMHKQISRMISIVNELLDFSRLSKNEKLETEKINVSDLLEEIRIKESTVIFNKKIEPNIYLNIKENLFIRMVQNLVDNAAKYNKANGTVNLSLHNEPNVTIIEVSDNGIGIAKEELPYIFDRFYQVDKSRHSSQSFGLGLSFVKEIVRLHGATITVDSKVGVGTTFKVSFTRLKEE